MPRSSSKKGSGSGEPQKRKKSKPLVVTGDRCYSCQRLKTERPLEGNCVEETCEACGGTGLSVSEPNCSVCAGHGSYMVRYGGCKALEEHYSTRPDI